MNGHQQTLLLGAGDNHALWLLQRKLQAHQEMRERLRLRLHTVREQAQRLVKRVQKNLSVKALEKATVFQIVKDLQQLFQERQRELDIVRAQRNLIKLKNPAREVRVRLKKLHVVPLAIPPAARLRFRFRTQ
jgi:hypothetical protein